LNLGLKCVVGFNELNCIACLIQWISYNHQQYPNLPKKVYDPLVYIPSKDHIQYYVHIKFSQKMFLEKQVHQGFVNWIKHPPKKKYRSFDMSGNNNRC